MICLHCGGTNWKRIEPIELTRAAECANCGAVHWQSFLTAPPITPKPKSDEPPRKRRPRRRT